MSGAKRYRSWWLAAAVTLLCAGSLHAEGWGHTWQVTQHPTLQLSLDGVDVVIETGSQDTIEAVLEADGWSMGKEPGKISQHQEGNVVTLQIHGRPFVGVRFMRLHLRVPSNVEANLRSGSGSVTLHGIHGQLHVSGTIGAVQVDGFDGALEAQSGSGSLHVNGRFDALNLRSRTGAIEADIAPGSMLSSDWRIESDAGSDLIRVFPALAAEVEARTGSGRIHSELQLVADGFQSKSEIRGKYNGGGPALMVSSNSGSIRLTTL